jgi:hypothetical protein
MERSEQAAINIDTAALQRTWAGATFRVANGWLSFCVLIVAIKLLLLWLDPTPKLYMGDSGSYIRTALIGSIPRDRGFNCGFEFEKGRQLLICMHDKASGVAALCGHNSNWSAFAISSRHRAAIPSNVAEIFDDDFPILHASICASFVLRDVLPLCLQLIVAFSKIRPSKEL